MRARNLKPALFKNEVLGTADPLYTILFEGLWCLADREGRLEDRPLRIKAEVLAYRENIDIEALLAWLHNHGFIVRYLACGQRLIQIIKFLEHQSPHKNEVPSVLPEWDGSASNQGCADLQPKTVSLALTPSSLTPDSGLLTADSLTHESTAKVESPSDQGASVPRATESEVRAHVSEIKADYPKAARPDWITGEHALRRAVETGKGTWAEIKAGVKRYAAHCEATGRMVSNPAKFFADIDRPWMHEWAIPIKPGALAKSNDEAPWAEAKNRAKAINFRDPHPTESVGAYMTAVKMEQTRVPQVPLSERRGLAGIKRIGAT